MGGFTPATLVVGVAATAALAGCFDPEFREGLACSPEGAECPKGYECGPGDQCRREGVRAPADAGARGEDATDRRDASPAVDGGPAPDAAADAGPAPTACEDALVDAEFCDGFEDEDLAAWASSYGEGTVERRTDTVYRGAGSLAATAGSEDLAAVSVEGLEGLSSDVYIRGYVFLGDEFELVDVGVMRVAGSDDGLAIGVEEERYPYVFVDAEGAGVRTSDVTVPRGSWTCLRAHIEVSPQAGAVDLWVEDELAASETGLNTEGSDPYTHFAAGITSPNPGGDDPLILLDDVAVSATPLPCD